MQHNLVPIALFNHSEYSLLDSILRIDELLTHAKEQGMTAIAISDRNNLYAAIKFYRAARKMGIKPIIGCDLSVRMEDESLIQITLLVQNQRGFINLCELLSFGYQCDQRKNEFAVAISRFNLQQCSGLIALCGNLQGDIARHFKKNDAQGAIAAAKRWQQLFPDRFYLQIHRNTAEERHYEMQLQTIAQQLSLTALAANLACFKESADFETHEIRVCISGGWQLNDARRAKKYIKENYLWQTATWHEKFADAPQLLANSVIVAQKCNLVLQLGKSYLPDFPLPEGENAAQYLQNLARDGLRRRFQEPIAERYWQRLELELKVIIDMGFAGYFLIVADFIAWARQNEIPVGPGRGSGAGSLVAYAVAITDIDPLAYDLLFERFLNPERVSMPDFDIDFCMDKRDLVIDYVAQKYGREKVSQIATHGTMAAKGVIRDVGRVLSMPYSAVDRIAKMIPNALKITLEDALGLTENSKKKPELFSAELSQDYQENEETKILIDSALKLEGLARSVGKHAGGVVIAPTKITDFVPLYAENAQDSASAQFDKDDVEAVGLVKFDFLGLRTLTLIDWALRNVNQLRRAKNETQLSLAELPLDDLATFKMLQSGRTTAIFQLESSGMKELIKKLKPDNIEDIIALVALYRPGPLKSGMVDDYVQRKHGMAHVVYPHPRLQNILKTTYGVFVYQEQVMQSAQELAAYSLGDADLLRRAISKKSDDVMREQGEIFCRKAIANGIDEKIAKETFLLMAQFAGYGFNKSHSAAYAILSYQTAWLKTHYGAPFMAAVLSSEMDNTTKIVFLIEECRSMGINVISPCINQSQYHFSVNKNGDIIYGLGAIKGVGKTVINAIIEERNLRGEFKAISEICERLDLKKLNKKTLEILVQAGAFDNLQKNRGGLFAALPQIMQFATQHHNNKSNNQQDMFGLFNTDINSNTENQLLTIKEDDCWDNDKQLKLEKKSLGLFLSGHPIKAISNELEQMCRNNLAKLQLFIEKLEKPKSKDEIIDVLLAGLVVDVRYVHTKKAVFLKLDDISGQIEIGIFGELIERTKDLLQIDNILVIKARISYLFYKEEWRIGAAEIYDFQQARFNMGRELCIHCDENNTNWQQLNNILTVLQVEKGMQIRIKLTINAINIAGDLKLRGNYNINSETYENLRQLFGDNALQIHY